MKNIKNEHGFTLIELLAVIVVLAIVLLMGAMAVIPRMTEARKQTFALEANTAIQGAQQYLMGNELKSKSDANKVFPTSTNGTVCVTIGELRTSGTIDFEDTYVGKIIVTKTSDNTYTYKISMTNGTLKVKDAGESGDVTSDLVSDYASTDNITDTCS